MKDMTHEELLLNLRLLNVHWTDSYQGAVAYYTGSPMKFKYYAYMHPTGNYYLVGRVLGTKPKKMPSRRCALNTLIKLMNEEDTNHATA